MSSKRDRDTFDESPPTEGSRAPSVFPKSYDHEIATKLQKEYDEEHVHHQAQFEVDEKMAISLQKEEDGGKTQNTSKKSRQSTLPSYCKPCEMPPETKSLLDNQLDNQLLDDVFLSDDIEDDAEESDESMCMPCGPPSPHHLDEVCVCFMFLSFYFTFFNIVLI